MNITQTTTRLALALSLLTAFFAAIAGEKSINTGVSTPSTRTIDAETLASYSDHAAALLNTEPLKRSQLPVAYLVNKDRLIELTCPERPELCAGKVAIFDKRYFYILLDESLTVIEPKVLNSFTIHELVHVYQHFRQTDNIRNSCNRQLQNEREAYRIQNRFLSDAGLHYNFGQELRGALCPVTAGED